MGDPKSKKEFLASFQGNVIPADQASKLAQAFLNKAAQLEEQSFNEDESAASKSREEVLYWRQKAAELKGERLPNREPRSEN